MFVSQHLSFLVSPEGSGYLQYNIAKKKNQKVALRRKSVRKKQGKQKATRSYGKFSKLRAAF